MISFYPGPSRLHPKVVRYMAEACREGVVSINHRSTGFMDLYRETTALFHEKLLLPSDYALYFVSSATECWEIIAQSLTKHKSLHIFNGAFGQKWYTYAARLVEAEPLVFNMEQKLLPAAYPDADVICITQNETSNGTQVKPDILKKIRALNPSALIAADATSSMGGINLPWQAADVWFASVQKCFGLPAGLGLLICSPAALSVAQSLQRNHHYNSLLYLEEMRQKWQTSYTPNVLNIYLLMRVLQHSRPVLSTEATLKSRLKKWEVLFDQKSTQLKLLVKNKAVRSHTVLAIESTPEVVKRVKAEALKAGFLLGEGYGKWKESTFRIANFPALKRSEIAKLMDFMYRFI
jgi:phosphoserine aminotransferase